MMTRIRDGNSGQVIGAGGSNSLSNPFAPTSMKIDEDEMDFIPFEHTQFSQDNLKSMSMLIILFERYFWRLIHRKNALINEIKQLNDQFARN
jgi:hypothetical protein